MFTKKIATITGCLLLAVTPLLANSTAYAYSIDEQDMNFERFYYHNEMSEMTRYLTEITRGFYEKSFQFGSTIDEELLSDLTAVHKILVGDQCTLYDDLSALHAKKSETSDEKTIEEIQAKINEIYATFSTDWPYENNELAERLTEAFSNDSEFSEDARKQFCMFIEVVNALPSDEEVMDYICFYGFGTDYDKQELAFKNFLKEHNLSIEKVLLAVHSIQSEDICGFTYRGMDFSANCWGEIDGRWNHSTPHPAYSISGSFVKDTSTDNDYGFVATIFSDFWKDDYSVIPVAIKAHKCQQDYQIDEEHTCTSAETNANAGDYTFELKVYSSTSDEPLTTLTATNDANGDVLFEDYTITSVGNYRFVVSEVKPDEKSENITYSDEVKTVEMTVKEDGKGTLTITSCRTTES